MALINVNPTRMALMDLKRRHKSAKRGHKLLKDKQDGLMQQFMGIIREAKTLREEVEEELGNVFKKFLAASAWMTDAQLQNALSSPQAKIELEVETKSVMSVKIPNFTISKEGTIKSYGYAGTNAMFDEAVEALEQVFEVLINLAQIEKQAEAMAIELETTRRRVNALEHKMIPDLEETVKYIKMKLDESERAGIIATMRIKASLEEQEAGIGLPYQITNAAITDPARFATRSHPVLTYPPTFVFGIISTAKNSIISLKAPSPFDASIAKTISDGCSLLPFIRGHSICQLTHVQIANPYMCTK
jgi:V/A-type H+-transporting ATPase subunit D